VHATLTQFIQSAGGWAPLLCLALFLAASLLMIWRLEAMSARGMEGTVLGTLFMPYCSGLGNLLFAFVLGRTGGNSREVMTNCLVNNVTNMTLLIGLPALIWGLSLVGERPKARKAKGKPADDKPRRNRFALLLTMLAVLFFVGVTWLLGGDGVINRTDGLVLVASFLFWQTFHVFEVLKQSGPKGRSGGLVFFVDLTLLVVGAYGVFASIDWLVKWLEAQRGGFFSAQNLGWLTGWLMVLPNALLALYYGMKRRAEVVYSSQIGDGHICIPLCIGIFAVFRPIPMPEFFGLGVSLLLGAVAVHFVFVAILGGMPRWMGALLVASYGVFVWKGLFN
jgi:cation:H+ antiporter